MTEVTTLTPVTQSLATDQILITVVDNTQPGGRSLACVTRDVLISSTALSSITVTNQGEFGSLVVDGNVGVGGNLGVTGAISGKSLVISGPATTTGEIKSVIPSATSNAAAAEFGNGTQLVDIVPLTQVGGANTLAKQGDTAIVGTNNGTASATGNAASATGTYGMVLGAAGSPYGIRLGTDGNHILAGSFQLTGKLLDSAGNVLAVGGSVVGTTAATSTTTTIVSSVSGSLSSADAATLASAKSEADSALVSIQNINSNISTLTTSISGYSTQFTQVNSTLTSLGTSVTRAQTTANQALQLAQSNTGTGTSTTTTVTSSLFQHLNASDFTVSTDGTLSLAAAYLDTGYAASSSSGTSSTTQTVTTSVQTATNTSLGVVKGGGTGNVTINSDGSMNAKFMKPLKLSSHGYLRWAGGSTMGQGGSTGYSFGGLFSIPGAFRAARLFFYNLDPTNIAGVGNTILIGASARSDHLAPVDAGGAYVGSGFAGWQTVGFDQGSLSAASFINSVAHPINGSNIGAKGTSIPVASGIDSRTWGKVWTDWAQIAPIDPQDGGLYHYVTTLVDIDSSFAHGSFGPSFNQVNNGYSTYSPDIGKVMRAAYLSGVQGAQPNNIDSAANSGSAYYGAPAVCGMEIMFEKKALTIISVGDSLGDNPYQGCYNGAEAAAAFITRDSGVPTCSFNMCRSAYAVQDFTRLAVAELPSVADAGVILIQCQSGNLDPNNADGNLLSWSKFQLGYVLDLAERAEALGMYPIIVGPAPAGLPASSSTADVTANSTYIATCQEIAAEAKKFGYPYLDRDVIWGYGDGSMKQDPQWWDVNTKHPTPAALRREGTYIQTILTPLLPR